MGYGGRATRGLRTHDPANPPAPAQPTRIFEVVDAPPDVRARSRRLDSIKTGQDLAKSLRASIKRRRAPLQVSVERGDVLVLDRRRRLIAEFDVADHAYQLHSWHESERVDSKYRQFDAYTVEDAMDELLECAGPLIAPT